MVTPPVVAPPVVAPPVVTPPVVAPPVVTPPVVTPPTVAPPVVAAGGVHNVNQSDYTKQLYNTLDNAFKSDTSKVAAIKNILYDLEERKDKKIESLEKKIEQLTKDVNVLKNTPQNTNFKNFNKLANMVLNSNIKISERINHRLLRF